MARIALFALVLGMVWIAAGHAAAQTRSAEAQDLFDGAMVAAREERWQEAALGFRRAYALAPRPELLLNIATAEVSLGHLVAAAEAYRTYIAAVPRGRLRRDATRALRALESRLSRLSVSVVGAPRTDARLDGAPLPAQEVFEVDPGRHRLLVGDASAPLAVRDIELAEGERLIVELVVAERPLPPVDPVPEVETPIAAPVDEDVEALPADVTIETPTDAPPPEPARGGGLSPLAISGLVVGITGALGAAIAGPWAVVQHGETRTRCGDAGTCTGSDVDPITALAITTDVSLGVLAVGAVLFVVGLVVGEPSDDVAVRGDRVEVRF